MAWSGKKRNSGDRYASRVVVQTPIEREKIFEEKVENAITSFKQSGRAFVIVDRSDRDNIIRRMWKEFPGDITMEETDYWKAGEYHIHFIKLTPIRPELVVDQPVAVYWGLDDNGQYQYYAGLITKRGDFDLEVTLNSGWKELIKIEESAGVVPLKKNLTDASSYSQKEIARERLGEK